jgi:hypothetical protein
VPERTASSPGLDGVLRLTWVNDNLSHVMHHCDADEPAGTWTGLACPDHGLAIGSAVDPAVLGALCARGDIADLLWEAPADLAGQHRRSFDAAIDAHLTGVAGKAEEHWAGLQATWSTAWAINCQTLEVLQQAGITRFAPCKPQRWVIASFEHHCGPHGVPRPHVHNIVVTALTRSAGAAAEVT